MALRRGKLDDYPPGHVLLADDFVSLEGQSIRRLADRAALVTVFGSSPDVGIAWIDSTEELVGWDGNTWVTIIQGYEQDVVVSGEDAAALQSATNMHYDNDYWHDDSIGQRVTARNIGLTGAQTGAHNPLGVVASADVEVFRTTTGGVAVWPQQYQRPPGYKATLTAVADADIQFLLVGAGGSGAPGRNAHWESTHPTTKSLMLAGGGGGGGEIRTLDLRVFKGQSIEVTGLSFSDGGGVQVRSGGILASAMAGAPSVRALPISTFFTAPNGIIDRPTVTEAVVPNGGASQWSQVVRVRDTIPALPSGITVAARYLTNGADVDGGVTSGNSDVRYYPSQRFGFGGGKSTQPKWWVAAGDNVDYSNPTRIDPSKPYAQAVFQANVIGGSGGGGSMISAGSAGLYPNPTGAAAPGGRGLMLDTDYWPTKYSELAPGGSGSADRQVDTDGSSTPYIRATTSSAPGAGGNGGVGEGSLGTVLSYPATGGQPGLVMVRWSPSGRPLAPHQLDYT